VQRDVQQQGCQMQEVQQEVQQEGNQMQVVEHQAMDLLVVDHEAIEEVQATPTKSFKSYIRKKLTPKKIKLMDCHV
jgi:hypothetical protein